ncbi:hypothetical protein [Streptomyces sp. NE06-03C]|nr:hypothetical protein [Streptomyces sp. NE06-03C]MDX2922478.1 hypothetical protein [Streptomyces sp. NE06-03C]
MAGTTAFVLVLLGCCVVAIVTVVAKARVKIARIQAGSGQDSRRG